MLVVGIIIIGAIEFVTVYEHKSFLYSMIPKLSNQDKIDEKIRKKQFWIVIIGLCWNMPVILIGTGEKDFYAAILGEKFNFTHGMFSLSLPLFLLIALICTLFLLNGRKMLLLLITLGILSLIVSCGLTFVALDFYGYPHYRPLNFTKGYDFPSWPYYYEIFLGTPVVPVVPLSTAVIILGFHILLEKRHSNTKKMPNDEEMVNGGFIFVGFIFPIIGFGFHVCYFVLSILSNQPQRGSDPYCMKFLSLEVVIAFTFTGFLAIINKSNKTSLFLRSLFLLVSISPSFCEHIFHKKDVMQMFYVLTVCVCIWCPKEIGKKICSLIDGEIGNRSLLVIFT
jgi:hypothetical protein